VLKDVFRNQRNCAMPAAVILVPAPAMTVVHVDRAQMIAQK